MTTPFPRLAGVELRKTLDTRAGPVLALLVVGTSLAGLGYALAERQPFAEALVSGLFGPQLLLPVIGVLAMTTEWTQRTALTTFTLTPRRGRVLGAKILAVLVLSTVVTAGVTALATIVGGPSTWDGSAVLGPAAVTAALVVQGIAFGALIQHSAAALVLYFLVPPVWNTASNALLPADVLRWVDVFAAFDALARFDATEAPTLTALALWIVLPLAVGIARGLRREVS